MGFCGCSLFPVYSTKFGAKKLPPELTHLCLLCCYDMCAALGHDVLHLLCQCIPTLNSELDKYYHSFWTRDEIVSLPLSVPEDERKLWAKRNTVCQNLLLARVGAPPPSC